MQEYEGDRHEAVNLHREARANAGDDVSLRARSEEGLASALFLLRTDLAAAAGARPRGGHLCRTGGRPSTRDRCSQRARTGRRGDGWRRVEGGPRARPGTRGANGARPDHLQRHLHPRRRPHLGRRARGGARVVRLASGTSPKSGARRTPCRGSPHSCAGPSSSAAAGTRRGDMRKRGSSSRSRRTRNRSACSRWGFALSPVRGGEMRSVREPTHSRRSCPHRSAA